MLPDELKAALLAVINDCDYTRYRMLIEEHVALKSTLQDHAVDIIVPRVLTLPMMTTSWKYENMLYSWIAPTPYLTQQILAIPKVRGFISATHLLLSVPSDARRAIMRRAFQHLREPDFLETMYYEFSHPSALRQNHIIMSIYGNLDDQTLNLPLHPMHETNYRKVLENLYDMNEGSQNDLLQVVEARRWVAIVAMIVDGYFAVPKSLAPFMAIMQHLPDDVWQNVALRLVERYVADNPELYSLRLNIGEVKTTPIVYLTTFSWSNRAYHWLLRR